LSEQTIPKAPAAAEAGARAVVPARSKLAALLAPSGVEDDVRFSPSETCFFDLEREPKSVRE